MSPLEECVLCKSRAMSSAGNEKNANQMKHQIRTIFVLRKLLEIQSSTCSDLLAKLGNPSVWVSYCVECFETVIDAERVFSKMVKLESKWKNLKQVVENRIFEHHNQKRVQQSSAKNTGTDSDIVGRLWEETIQRLSQVSRNENSLTDSTNAENVFKVEIDYSYDNDSVIDGASNENLNSPDESEGFSPKEKGCRDDSDVDLVKSPEKSLGCSNEMNSVRRTGSGRLMKSKNKNSSDADDSDFRFDQLDEQNDNSEDEMTNQNDPNSNLQCPQCNRAFKSKEGFDYHRKRYHGQDSEKPYRCSICDKGMYAYRSLLRHMEQQHTKGGEVSGKEKSYPCEKCPKSFFFSRTLRAHIINEHSEEPAKKKQIVCSKCELQFDAETDLKRHILSAHSQNEDTDKSAQFWFKCHLCQKNFITAQLLEIHTKSVHDKAEELDGNSTLQENFKCKICDRIFPSFIGLTRHQSRTHVSGTQKPFRCPKCPKGFFGHKGFRNHCIKEHNISHAKVEKEKKILAKGKQLACSMCELTFTTETDLEGHISTTHSNNEGADKNAKFWFKCHMCKKKFVTAQLLEIHTLSVHDKPEEMSGKSTVPENFKCNICERIFPSLHGLTRHQVRSHVSGKQKPFRCSLCPKGFFEYKRFHQHCIKEHDEVPIKKIKEKQKRNVSQYRKKPWACSQCDLRFISTVGLEKHILKEHDENFTVQCSGCPKRFKHSFLMNQHFRIVHRKEKNFICEICSKSFSSKLQMKHHQMRQHERSEELKCKECGHISSEPSALKKHIMSVHNKEKCAFKCPVCDYRTICNSALKYHILGSHTNKKMHSCTLCDKSYSHSSSLTDHMRTHTGERPYKCQFCEKSFINRDKRRRHEEDLHSTEKHYQCEICGKRFPSRHYLATHMYDTHRKRQRNPVPEKILIDDELLKEVINQDSKE